MSFTLTTADQLAGLAVLVNGGNNFSGKTIMLGNNISLSGYQTGSGWTPISNESCHFSGTFDGMGHKITGLYIYTTNNYQGLFGYTYNAVIRNVIVESPNIYCGQAPSTSNVGGIVGVFYGSVGMIENCAVVGGVVEGAGGHVGGVVGLVSNANIINCFGTSDAISARGAGGVAGALRSSSIMKNCFSTGNITGTDSTGGVVGYIDLSSEMQNCYFTGNVSGTGYVGGVVGYVNDSEVRNCVFLGGNVTASGSLGRVVGITYNSYTLSGNYANAAAVAGGTAFPGEYTTTGRDGASISSWPESWWTSVWSSVFASPPTPAAPWVWDGGPGPALYWLELPAVNAATLPIASIGTTYSANITATNNPTGFVLSDAPAWLSINNSGVLSGTPTAGGTFTFTVKASNSNGASLFWRSFSITVSAGPSFTVTFDSQGGNAVTSVAAITGTTITAPVLPSRAGYTFAGWYKETACINAWNFDADTVTSDITLYAKWVIGDIPGSVASLDITGFPLTIAPGKSFDVNVAYNAFAASAPDPLPTLAVSMDAQSARLVRVDIVSQYRAIVTALERSAPVGRNARGNSAIHGDAGITFTASQALSDGTTLSKSATKSIPVADDLATSIAVSEDVVLAFEEANTQLVSSDETILPGNIQPPITSLGEDWHLIEGLDKALIEIENPDAYVLPECFEPSGRDAARIDIDISNLVPAGKKGLLPLMFRVKVRSGDLFALYGEDAGRAMLASPEDHLDEIFTKILIHKEIMEGEREGWYTRLVNGVMKPADAVAKGILEVTGGESLTLTLSYYILDDGILEAFERDGYLIVPDGLHDGEILDPIWLNMWKPGYAPGGNSMQGSGSGAGGSGCASWNGAVFLALIALAASSILKRKRSSR
jgi:uncharacterized repeat protein (TIGR02543 family)